LPPHPAHLPEVKRQRPASPTGESAAPDRRCLFHATRKYATRVYSARPHSALRPAPAEPALVLVSVDEHDERNLPPGSPPLFTPLV
jgi:hypothetical protein